MNDLIVLTGHKIEYEPGDPFQREFALRRIESGEAMDDAEAALAECYSLSVEGRHGLHLIRLRAEGHRPRGKGTLTAQRTAREDRRRGRREPIGGTAMKISADLPDELGAALKERARAEGRAASAVVRRALVEHLSSAATPDLRPTESRTAPGAAVEARSRRGIEGD